MNKVYVTMDKSQILNKVQKLSIVNLGLLLGFDIQN